MENYIDKNYKLSKSYTKNGLFNTSRCRIEPQLFTNLVYEYIFNDINNNDLCEKYLNISRNMNKNEREYQNSHSMDTNSIFRLLRLKKNKYLKLNELYYFDDIKSAINNYINNIITTSVDKETTFYKKWSQYFESEKWKENNCIEQTKKIITNFKNNNFDNYKIIDELEENYSLLNDNVIFTEKNSEYDDEQNQLIRKKGENIVYQYLSKCFDQVEYIAKEHEYYPYDFLIKNHNNEIYVKVKTTINPVKLNFIISRNQLNFYKENKNNYWLILVRNLNPYNNDNDIVPFINIVKNPNIIINDSIVGFKDNSIYIAPWKYTNY